MQGVSTVLEFQPEVVIRHLPNVMSLMYNALLERDQQLGLAACEFWSGLIALAYQG